MTEVKPKQNRTFYYTLIKSHLFLLDKSGSPPISGDSKPKCHLREWAKKEILIQVHSTHILVVLIQIISLSNFIKVIIFCFFLWDFVYSVRIFLGHINNCSFFLVCSIAWKEAREERKKMVLAESNEIASTFCISIVFPRPLN